MPESQTILFPPNFIWGAATSAYQIEGGADATGKGPSIWDAFCTIPGKVHAGADARISCDHYHRWPEDVALMQNMGIKAYRFSLSWPRILPTGRGKIAADGLRFYDELINGLLQADIEPWVTLYHWDLPLALQFEEDGWLGAGLADAFADYADLCFHHFGDRVKHWITLNEPWVVAMLGYGQGVFAPGRSSTTEPYLAAHNLLRAHARAVHVYRSKYQTQQQGQIGITNNCDWREPLTSSVADQDAAERALEFFLGWFTDPVYKGHYPPSMLSRIGHKLPLFTMDEVALLKGSSDFFGLNHYTTMYAADAGDKIQNSSVYGNGGLSEDQQVNLSLDPSWPLTAMPWAIVPWGCRKLLEWISRRYDYPPIIITENGGAFPDELRDGIVQDDDRIAYVQGYLEEIHQSIQQGVRCQGYFIWSLLDNFEWASGYSKRFGVHYVDFQTLERRPKASAKWYAHVVQHNGW